jgi:hypothetical protein
VLHALCTSFICILIWPQWLKNTLLSLSLLRLACCMPLGHDVSLRRLCCWAKSQVFPFAPCEDLSEPAPGLHSTGGVCEPHCYCGCSENGKHFHVWASALNQNLTKCKFLRFSHTWRSIFNNSVPFVCFIGNFVNDYYLWVKFYSATPPYYTPILFNSLSVEKLVDRLGLHEENTSPTLQRHSWHSSYSNSVIPRNSEMCTEENIFLK